MRATVPSLARPSLPADATETTAGPSAPLAYTVASTPTVSRRFPSGSRNPQEELTTSAVGPGFSGSPSIPVSIARRYGAELSSQELTR